MSWVYKWQRWVCLFSTKGVIVLQTVAQTLTETASFLTCRDNVAKQNPIPLSHHPFLQESTAQLQQDRPSPDDIFN